MSLLQFLFILVYDFEAIFSAIRFADDDFSTRGILINYGI